MNVALVTHFYPPEPCAAATRMASLVDALANEGHRVTVITTFPSFPTGRFATEDRFVLCRAEKTEWGSLVRLFSAHPHRFPAARLIHWTSAAVSAAFYLSTRRTRYDLIIVSAPPITLALPALAGAFRHRAKLVVDVRDVFPDIAIAMGEWRKDSLVSRAAEFVVRRLYRRADLVVAVTPTAIAQIATRGVERSRLVLARNAAEITAGEPGSATVEPEGFTAIYAGNLGLATDVDLLVDAAALLSEDSITIKIVGDGAQRARLEDRLQKEAIKNVVMTGSRPRDEAMRMVAASDVSIVPLRKGIAESVPTKLYDSLALARPVIVAADGEAAIEGNSLGAVCTPPGDACALAAELRKLSQMDPSGLRAIGEKGKVAVQNRASRAGIMKQLVQRLSSLAAS